jgi:hypothetical protein
MRERITTGMYVSGAGHVALFVVLLSGWGMKHNTVPFDVTQVSVISGAEFEALFAATTPDPATLLDPSPVAPEIEETSPPALPEDAAEPAPPPPDPVPPPPPEEEAPPPPPPEPVPPPAEVTDVIPEPVPPQPEQLAGAPDLAPSLRPQPRPANRVAPEAVAPPPPEAEIAPEVREAAEPTPPEEPAEPAEIAEEVTPAAPEEATTQIVTEADTPSGAVTTSLRPAVRPNRPTPPAETPAETSTATATPPASTPDDVAAALAEAGAGQSGAPAASQGPPMTGSERDAFRVAVQQCWNLDVGSESARIEVKVGFELDRSGRVVGEVRFISATPGSDAAVRSAFEAARRAVLRCQADGYQLPPEKYDEWRLVELTFNPDQMRNR